MQESHPREPQRPGVGSDPEFASQWNRPEVRERQLSIQRCAGPALLRQESGAPGRQDSPEKPGGRWNSSLFPVGQTLNYGARL